MYWKFADKWACLYRLPQLVLKERAKISAKHDAIGKVEGHDVSVMALCEDFDAFEAALVRALTRICKMCRAPSSKEDDTCLPFLDAALALSPKELVVLVAELNRNGINDGWAILLMYSPNILQALKSKNNLVLGLRCLYNLYSMTRKKLNEELKKSRTDGEEALRDEVAGIMASANGVYEVGCYPVLNWTDQLESILKHKDALRIDHLYLRESLGEATTILKPPQ